MKYQTMRIDHLNHLYIEASTGEVRFTVNGDALVVEPVLSEKKPRTKVEYVECNESINEIAKLMIDGEAFYSKDGGGKFYWRLNAFWRSNTALSGLNGFDFHRRIETPMTEREAFIDGYEKLIDGFMGDETKVADDWAGYVFDKLVN